MAKRAKITLQSGEERQWNNVYQRISWWNADRMAEAKVMVVGAGALGNEVLKNLALLNVGNILVTDFDHIEFSNLSRSVLYRESDIGKNKAATAAAKVCEMNPNVAVKSIHGDIAIDVGLGVFRRMDVIIGCLDNRVARLFINRHCFKVGKIWVDAAIENLAGQLDVFKPGVACYECQLSQIERDNIRYKWGCADTAERNATMGRIPTTPISASILGAMQAQEALKVIFGNEKQSLVGQRFKYEGMNNFMITYPVSPLKDDCESHADLGKILEAPELSCEKTVTETLAWLAKKLDSKNPKIILFDEVVLEVTTEKSEISHAVLMPRLHLSAKEVHQFRQIDGEGLRITNSLKKLDASFPHPSATLRQIGIPPLDILTVETETGYFSVELTGDLGFLRFEKGLK
jgi:molybdopterin/thiamine biosynthesis adenylyltransferase